MNSWLKVNHSYTKCYASSVCLEQSITVPNSERTKCTPHIPKQLLHTTFQYYPSINGYDFQKVSPLQDCNPNFNTYMAPTI